MLSVRWTPPDGTVRKYRVVCRNGDDIVQMLTTTDTTITVSSLQKRKCYILEVSAKFENGKISEPASIRAWTGERNTFKIK